MKGYFSFYDTLRINIIKREDSIQETIRVKGGRAK